MAQAAEQRKIQAIQALQEQAYKFCASHLQRLFTYDIQAKTSPDVRFSAHAALCKNDIYAILQLSMTMFIPPDSGKYRMLRTTEPDLSMVSHSEEGKDFIEKYQNEMNRISDAYDAEVSPAPAPAAAIEENTRNFPIRRLDLGSSPNTPNNLNENIMSSQHFGGRRLKKRNKTKRRR
jgi:hypothetical protein